MKALVQWTLQIVSFPTEILSFKRELMDKGFITKVRLRLHKQPHACVDYLPLKDYLKSYLRHHNYKLSPESVFNAICNLRAARLPSPDKKPNVGSFFKNPIVDQKVYQKLLSEDENLVYYPQEDGRVKLSGGYLIEKIGLKGFRKKGDRHRSKAIFSFNQCR